MKHLIALLLLLLAATSAQAVDRQYCACDTGAASGCTATTPDLPSEFTLNTSAAAGDRFLFCEGGSWVRTGALVMIFEDTATCVPTCAPNYIIFEPYTAGWGGSGIRPKLTNTTGSAFQFGSFGETGMDGGYIIRGLALSGNGTGANAINMGGNFRDIVIEDNTLELYTGAFIEMTQSAPNVSTARNYNVQILNNDFQNAVAGSVACIHGGGTDVLIQGNDFYKCGGCAATCHSLYLASITFRLSVLNNTFAKAGAYARGDEICESGNISIRSKMDQLRVEGNVIDNSAGVAGSCGGIQLKPAYCYECVGDNTNAAIWDVEYLRRTVLRNNTVIDSGSNVTGIEFSTARNIIVEGNVYKRTIASSNAGFEYPGNTETNPPRTYADETDEGGTIRNNTCIFTNGAEGGTCFALNALAGHGTGVTFTNNIAWMTTPASGTQSCFRHGPLSSYTAWDGNICHGFDRWSTTASTGGGYSNHAAAHAAGFDTWSSAGGLADDDPLITTPTSGNSWSAAITSDSSPAHNNGINAYKSKFDRLGCLRDSTPSIGAEERGGTGCQTTIGAPQFAR